MSARRRVVLCLLSVILAFIGVAVSGSWHQGAKLLHVWYVGVLTFFLIIFSMFLLLSLGGRLVRSAWLIPISAALSYPAFALAYLANFAIFEHQRFSNALTHLKVGDVPDVLLMCFVLLPTISVTWLFGAMAGLMVLLLGYLTSKKSFAAV
jgi:hypothetical protein